MRLDPTQEHFILSQSELDALWLNEQSRQWPVTAAKGLLKAVEMSRDIAVADEHAEVSLATFSNIVMAVAPFASQNTRR